MSLVLDAGAFVAIERADRDVIALIKAEMLTGRAPITHGGVVAQVWRGGTGRQANVARVLDGVEIVPLDGALGRRVGNLLARSRSKDAIDAAIVLVANHGDTVLTSDVGDLRKLAEAAGLEIELVQV